MRRIVVLVAFLALVAAAPAGASVKSPCALVTAANATKALGVTVPASTPEKLGLYEACTYASGGKRLTVLVRGLTRTVFDLSAKSNPGPVVHVSGIGSDAYSAAGPTLLLWKSGTEVTVLATGVANALTVEESLGRTAASRL
ncbi:MAG: hypothetical protein ABSC56_06030 [Solirubrobacteraceae bacterium]|jgi:hypothetical protein